MNKILIILIIAIVLVFLDKFITVLNVNTVSKNNPNIDKFSIEKNPIQKYFFIKFGLIEGAIIYFLISLITFLVAYYCLSLIWPNYALYIMVMIYGLVIFNNLFFLLKYSKII